MGVGQGVVTALFRAIASRQPDIALELIHPAIVWEPTEWSGSSALRGRAGVRKWFDQFGPDLQDLAIDVQRIEQVGGWVLASGVVRDTRDGIFTVQTAWRFAVEDAMIVEARAFSSWEEALEAAGG